MPACGGYCAYRSHAARVSPRYDRPGVLLMGSPVLFPNYKIPFLIREIGLDIVDTADAAALKLTGTFFPSKSIR